jgi:hypothetical protein
VLHLVSALVYELELAWVLAMVLPLAGPVSRLGLDPVVLDCSHRLEINSLGWDYIVVVQSVLACPFRRGFRMWGFQECIEWPGPW